MEKKNLVVWEGPKVSKPDTRGRILDAPEPEEYFIGVRTHQGLQDKDCIEIFNSATYEQAVEYSERNNPEDLAVLLVKLGKRYNEAKMVIEIEGHGITLLGQVYRLGYTNLYSETTRDLTTAHYGMALSAKLGWETTEQNKFKMIDDLASYIRDKKLKINSKALIKELRAYVVDAEGETKLQAGSCDNRVVATAICLQAIIKHRKWNYIKLEKEAPFDFNKWKHQESIRQVMKEQEEREYYNEYGDYPYY